MLAESDTKDEPPLYSMDWEADDAELRLRDVLKKHVPGLCVMDVGEDNILNFTQSDWTLIERDFRVVFPPVIAAQLEQSCKQVVVDALAVRRELINYKKLCLHLWQAGMAIDKDLRQLTSFFYCKVLADEDSERRGRYLDLTPYMNECRGVVAALHDARYFGKAICALPRLPQAGIPVKLEKLPESLEVWKPVAQAREFAQNYNALDAYWAARWDDAGDEGVDKEASVRDIHKPQRTPHPWQSERQVVSSTLGMFGLERLRTTLDKPELRLPALAKQYVDLVLVARGASKALSIGAALNRYIEALRDASKEAEKTMTDLRNLIDNSKDNASSMSAGLNLTAEKHWRSLDGIVKVIHEMLKWLQPISRTRASDSRVFVSGARGATAFVPKGFADFLGPYRGVVAKHREAMLTEIREVGWPSSTRPENEMHLHSCKQCEAKHAKLWLHRQICFTCEDAVRQEGRCPYTQKCGTRSFCPHARRCIVCEAWSCEACSLLRGDSEDVWQLVGQMQPTVVFLDFDRTLATTKAGGSPLQGSHSVDPDLAAVCNSHNHVQIVTRNSQKEDIEIFLKQKCVPVRRVRSLKHEGKKKKSEVILDELEMLSAGSNEKGILGIFVDDDIAELTEPSLRLAAEAGRLCRFLLVRGESKI